MTFNQSYGFIASFQIDTGFSILITHILFTFLYILYMIAMPEDVYTGIAIFFIPSYLFLK